MVLGNKTNEHQVSNAKYIRLHAMKKNFSVQKLKKAKVQTISLVKAMNLI